MLKLNIQVPAARDRTAIATLRDGFKTVAIDHAVASATPTIAVQRGNPACDPLRLWGHPPFGSYRLLNHQSAEREQVKEYGGHLLLFEPESGPALDAESFGRLALLVYSGPAGGDKRMRRTQGGLRLTDKMLYAILPRLDRDREMVLELTPLGERSWWQFWKSQMATRPLSVTHPGVLQPPIDELSILEALLQHSVRRVRRPAIDDNDTFSRDSGNQRSSSSSSGDAFEGKGGTSGGAGAGGSWSDAPSKGPAVDNSGRIVAAAAGLAAIAGAATAGSREFSAAAVDADNSGFPTANDTTTSTAY